MTAFTPEASRALGGPSWLADRRLAALEAFDLGAPPSSGEEIWRYSRVDDLDPGAWSPAPATTAAAPPGPVGTASAGRVVVANGRVVSVELDPALESKGVVLGALSAGVGNTRSASCSAATARRAASHSGPGSARDASTVKLAPTPTSRLRPPC